MTKKRLQKSESIPSGFTELLANVKQRIQTAQTRAMANVNSELIRLYWDIGRMINEQQESEGWVPASSPDSLPN